MRKVLLFDSFEEEHFVKESPVSRSDWEDITGPYVVFTFWSGFGIDKFVQASETQVWVRALIKS